MIHGTYRKSGVHRMGRMLFGIVCVCCVCLSLAACRSHRQVVEETHREVHESVGQSVDHDTLRATTTAAEVQTDTTSIAADVYFHAVIDRDSAGRVVEITARHKATATRDNRRVSGHIGRVDQVKVSHGDEIARTVDTVTQKKEEVTEDAGTGIPLECRIGWTIVAALIIFYTGDLIYRQWKKKRL